MTVPYSLRQQGYAIAEGDPVLTPQQTQAIDVPLAYAFRAVVEMDTLHCRHCGGCVIKNPDRVRPRGHCMKCNWYVCDPCAFRMTLPDYEHETLLGKAEKLKSALANLKEL